MPLAGYFSFYFDFLDKHLLPFDYGLLSGLYSWWFSLDSYLYFYGLVFSFKVSVLNHIICSNNPYLTYNLVQRPYFSFLCVFACSGTQSHTTRLLLGELYDYTSKRRNKQNFYRMEETTHLISERTKVYLCGILEIQCTYLLSHQFSCKIRNFGLPLYSCKSRDGEWWMNSFDIFQKV